LQQRKRREGESHCRVTRTEQESRVRSGIVTDGLRRKQTMKTASRGIPNCHGSPARQPSTWRGRSEQILLNQVGCEARKTPAVGEVFFLDFYLYKNLSDGMRRPVSSGMRYAPNVRRARGTKKETGDEEGPATQLYWKHVRRGIDSHHN
jgi:hypothetical protein